MFRKRYTEDEKLKSVAYLIANGYPIRKGSITYTQRKLKVSNDSLHRWYNSVNLEKLEKQVMELEKLLETELEDIFHLMKSKRVDATYRDLTTALGVLTDKLIVLQGGVNSRTESISTSWKDLIEQARQDKPSEIK